MTELLKEYRNECDAYKVAVEELTEKKNELELYNKKANEEILVLVNTLKAEQEKQKQLSNDLESLTNELKTRRASKTSFNY